MDWKALTLFMMIVVPLMLILTRALGWLADRKKKRPGAALMGAAKLRAERILEDAREWLKQLEKLDWAEPKIGKPYATYEEYKKDLMGAVPVEDFLERCRAGVPKDPMKATLAARQKLASIQQRLAETHRRMEAKKESVINPVTGRWYRRRSGELVCLIRTDDCVPGFGSFLCAGTAPSELIPFAMVTDALPRQGEWWLKKDCGREHGVRWLYNPIRWEYTNGKYVEGSTGLSELEGEQLFAREREAAACGCLVPVNFGRGQEPCKACGGFEVERQPEGHLFSCGRCHGRGVEPGNLSP